MIAAPPPLIRDAAGTVLGRLRRASERDADDAALLTDLTAWRNTHRRFFLTQFRATVPRTEGWLRRAVLSNPTRALFLIEDDHGTTIGHLGVQELGTDAPELDNMIRGRAGGDPQLMFWAEVAVIEWTFQDPRVKSACLHVFSNNWIPIGIHRSIGFVPGEVRKLSRLKVGEEEHLVPNSTEGEPEKFGYLRMTLSREAFDSFRAEKTSWSR
jgi:hypothetical protein